MEYRIINESDYITFWEVFEIVAGIGVGMAAAVLAIGLAVIIVSCLWQVLDNVIIETEEEE